MTAESTAYPSTPPEPCLRAFPEKVVRGFSIHEFRHACAILREDFPSEFADITTVLSGFALRKSWILEPGGRKSKISSWIDGELAGRGWLEKHFDTQIKVDEQLLSSPTHSVDCFKNRVALEIEWNNKDPFFDRDLNNFRLLFELRVVSVGVIVTRADELQEIFDRLQRGHSYGQSTTHLNKLLPKVMGGGGGGCPLLIFAIRPELYDEDC